MGHDPEPELADIGAWLDRIKDIIAQGELPPNLAGDLMSQSLQEFYDKLSNRVDEIRATLNNRRKLPALLALVEMKWLEKAFDEFKSGKQEIYFVTNAEIGKAAELPIKNVYFKTTGTTTVVARAKFTGVTGDNPSEKRLSGQDEQGNFYKDGLGKFYYGFREITWLPPIPLSSLQYFETGGPVPNALPGATIISEISKETLSNKQ